MTVCYYRLNDNLNQRLGRLLVQNNGLQGVIYAKFIGSGVHPRMATDMDTCQLDPYYVDGSGQFCYPLWRYRPSGEQGCARQYSLCSSRPLF